MGLWLRRRNPGVAENCGDPDRIQSDMVPALARSRGARSKRTITPLRRKTGAPGKQLRAWLWRRSEVRRVSGQGVPSDRRLKRLAGVPSSLQVQASEFLAELLAD